MLPIIVLCGRPNVGKSTLFNRLVGARTALVADQPGLTRDRIYGTGRLTDRAFVVVDTGGLASAADDVIHQLASRQVARAIVEADAILFIVDGRAGLTTEDEAVARRLRSSGKPVYVVANKAEGLASDHIAADFYGLGLGEVYAVSAAHGDGVRPLLEHVLAAFPAAEEPAEEVGCIKITVAGRPNVGKSTLINRIVGEERVVASDLPGTTRDAVHVPFERQDRRYLLIDTAGVRRRARLTEKIEKFSVAKTLQAVAEANVVILVTDARQGIGDQDARLLDTVLDSGKGLVIAVNKWDGLSPEQRTAARDALDRKLSFFSHAEVHYISALHGSGVGTLMDAVDRAYAASMERFSTPQLTRLLQRAVEANQPPLVKGRRVKLRYAHQGGHNPPVIVVHGSQVAALPATYRRYLANFFITALGLHGTPLRVEFRQGENPYSPKGGRRPAAPVRRRRPRGA